MNRSISRAMRAFTAAAVAAIGLTATASPPASAADNFVFTGTSALDLPFDAATGTYTMPGAVAAVPGVTIPNAPIQNLTMAWACSSNSNNCTGHGPITWAVTFPPELYVTQMTPVAPPIVSRSFGGGPAGAHTMTFDDPVIAGGSGALGMSFSRDCEPFLTPLDRPVVTIHSVVSAADGTNYSDETFTISLEPSEKCPLFALPGNMAGFGTALRQDIFKTDTTGAPLAGSTWAAYDLDRPGMFLTDRCTTALPSGGCGLAIPGRYFDAGAGAPTVHVRWVEEVAPAGFARVRSFDCAYPPGYRVPAPQPWLDDIDVLPPPVCDPWMSWADPVAATLSGRVFVDGTLDPVDGVQVTVVDGAGFTTSVTTGADGSYSVTGLAPGDVTVTEVQPAGFGQGIVEPDDVIPVTLAAGDTVVGNDFSETLGSISGTVFIDGSLAPVPDATVTLSSAAGPDVVTVTDAAGNFQFAGLRAGTFTVTETQPAALDPGQVVPSNVQTVVLAAGEHLSGFDFSETAPVVPAPADPPAAAPSIPAGPVAGQVIPAATTTSVEVPPVNRTGDGEGDGGLGVRVLVVILAAGSAVAGLFGARRSRRVLS